MKKFLFSFIVLVSFSPLQSMVTDFHDNELDLDLKVSMHHRGKVDEEIINVRAGTPFPEMERLVQELIALQEGLERYEVFTRPSSRIDVPWTPLNFGANQGVNRNQLPIIQNELPVMKIQGTVERRDGRTEESKNLEIPIKRETTWRMLKTGVYDGLHIFPLGPDDTDLKRLSFYQNTAKKSGKIRYNGPLNGLVLESSMAKADFSKKFFIEKIPLRDERYDAVELEVFETPFLQQLYLQRLARDEAYAHKIARFLFLFNLNKGVFFDKVKDYLTEFYYRDIDPTSIDPKDYEFTQDLIEFYAQKGNARDSKIREYVRSNGTYDGLEELLQSEREETITPFFAYQTALFMKAQPVAFKRFFDLIGSQLRTLYYLDDERMKQRARQERQDEQRRVQVGQVYHEDFTDPENKKRYAQEEKEFQDAFWTDPATGEVVPESERTSDLEKDLIRRFFANRLQKAENFLEQYKIKRNSGTLTDQDEEQRKEGEEVVEDFWIEREGKKVPLNKRTDEKRQELWDDFSNRILKNF